MGLFKDLSDRFTNDIQDGKMVSNVVDHLTLIFYRPRNLYYNRYHTIGSSRTKRYHKIHELSEEYKFFMER